MSKSKLEISIQRSTSFLYWWSLLIGTIKHLSVHLPRKSLLTTLWLLVIYDNPVNESLINKLEKVQYQACLAITGAIQGTSRESLYKELITESLQSRQWYRKMVFFNKVFNGLTPIISNDIERQLLKYKS